MKRCYTNTFFTLNKKVKAKTKTVKHILAVSHRSNGWKFKKKCEPLCPIQPLSHPIPLSVSTMLALLSRKLLSVITS
jgi:hypothetical protein